ncbi:MAG TPA: CGNR zinc finger domain-containing protein [Streptosporangiaceae bacterium]|nr:CGNR zinc finger domain-containing protein [Streptosporangiaceae bacterium]
MTGLGASGASPLPDWVPAKERRPAPGSLLLVQSFVNTWNIDEHTDELQDVDSGASWLRRAGLLGPDTALEPAELRLCRDVRESLRELMARNSQTEAPATGDLGPVEGVLDRQDRQPGDRLRLAIDQAGHVTVAPSTPGTLVSGLLGLLLLIRDAQRDGQWDRLKICGNADCRWAFYDRSHSRIGAWCEMASCGNMIKNRNFRARRRVGQPPGQ